MKRHIICILLASVWASATQADLLGGLLDSAPITGRVAIGEFGFGAEYPVLQARPFSTGGTAYTLESIFFGSHLYWGSGSGGITVSVYDNSGSVPNALVSGGLDLFSATSSTVDQVLVANAAITLAANSTYWFVASVDQSAGDTRYWWDLTDSDTIDADVAGTALPLLTANNATGWTHFSDESMVMSIYGAAIPEPGSVSLIGLGAAGVWLARKKKVNEVHRYR